MRVICRMNHLAAVTDTDLQKRLSRLINIDGPIDGLTVEKEYAVQAVEFIDGGLWVYLQTLEAKDYPDLFPAEFFELSDSKVPSSWHFAAEEIHANTAFKRLTFWEWANDDEFYEKLLEGDPYAVSIYRMRKQP